MIEEIVKKYRKLIPEMIAKEILEVQPMNSDLYSNLMKEAISENELIAQGYKPVSNLGLMWIKEN